MEVVRWILALVILAGIIAIPAHEFLKRRAVRRRLAMDRGYSDTLRECGAVPSPTQEDYCHSLALDADFDDAEPPAAFRMNRERRGSWPHNSEIFGGNAHQRRVFRRFVERGCV